MPMTWHENHLSCQRQLLYQVELEQIQLDLAFYLLKMETHLIPVSHMKILNSVKQHSL
uniref:Uncharacterized protein n=1 Tax=Rhizophora mucronata TaxID=61149 RepID=A0A2P2L5E8_RHIMU